MILQKDLTGQGLVQKIEYYAANREALVQMASKAGSFGKPRAAREIVDDIYELIN